MSEAELKASMDAIVEQLKQMNEQLQRMHMIQVWLVQKQNASSKHPFARVPIDIAPSLLEEIQKGFEKFKNAAK